ncbi:N-acetylmuramoyl-L-alanine amidase [Corynebacterium sp. L4756]|uniref:N-acetylmuramoyl-L-alanine amidase n=1 Tax=unclassified Corynebacterium TaxID=2624378 RepID=UPI00374D2E27
MQQRRRLVPTKSSWATPVTAVVAAIAVAAAAAFGGNQILNTQDGGSGPIQASTSSANFGDGDTVVVDDPAIASQGEGAGPRAVKEFRQDDPFSMFALTWQGQKDVAAFVRPELEDGTWGEWFSIEPMDVITEGTNGTDLIFVGDTNAVQVSVGNVDLGVPTEEEVAEELGEDAANTDDAATEEAPAEEAEADAAPSDSADDATAEADTTNGADGGNEGDVQNYDADVTTPSEEENPAGDLVQEASDLAGAVTNGISPATAPMPTDIGDIAPVADSDELPADSGAVSASDLEAVFIDGKAQNGGIANMADTEGLPSVVSRSAWGADESIRCSDPTFTEPTKALTLHHTAGSNNYTQAQAAAQVRGIYQYHAQTLGWCDMGYNVLVDKFGTIYEGRYGGLERGVMGAHVGGFNSNTWGISMMGNYETAQPSTEMLNSVTSIAAWKAANSGFDPSGTVNLTSGGFGASKYPAGATATVPTFHGHGDLHNTQCPGGNVIARWGEIRNATKTKYDALIASGAGEEAPIDSPDPGTGEGGEGGEGDGATGGLDTLLPALSSLAEGSSNSSASADGGSAEASSNISPEQVQSLATVAAAVAGLAIAAGAVTLPEEGTEVAPGVTTDAIPGILSQVLSVVGDEETTQSFNAIINAFGPALGAPVGGPNSENAQMIYQLFTNGVVLSSEDTGTHALIGEFARAWAQDDNATQLGLPTTDQYAVDQANNAVNEATGGNSVRVDFQGGYITYDPNTATVDVHTN